MYIFNISGNAKRKSDQLAYSIVFHYSKYDKYEKKYLIDLNDIPDHDLFYLTSLLLSEDSGVANEATGSDNYFFKKEMLPAMIHLFKKPNDSEMKSDFVDAWKKGVLAYMENYLIKSINEQLDEYNFNNNEGGASWVYAV